MPLFTTRSIHTPTGSGATATRILRWVGTEAGNIGHVNWSLMRSDKDPEWADLHYGIEDGDVWCPGETNTSIRPGWFYHSYEDIHVKSLSKLMDTYYKSVGRNSTLLLNFPVMPNGLISPVDSVRGVAFNRMVNDIFSNDLARDIQPAVVGDTVYTLEFDSPVECNRFMAGEKLSSAYNIAMIHTPNPSIMIDLEGEKTISALRYLPLQQTGAEGLITHYSVWAMIGGEWHKITEGEFSNIENNPIWQSITLPEVRTGLIRLDAERLNKGERLTYDDLEVVCKQAL